MVFIKIHDALTKIPTEEYIIPLDATYGAIYLIRNPLDVAVSFMFHLVSDMSNADKKINKHIILANNNGFDKQLRQKLLSWREHAESWINCKKLRKLVIRYEDLKNEPYKYFKKTVDFLKWDYTQKEIELAI